MAYSESAAAVYVLIISTIDIIEVSIETYKAVQDKSGIPKKLKKVSDTFPSLVGILRDAEHQYRRGRLDEQTWVNGEEDVRRCKATCQELQDVVLGAYPKVDASRVERFFKATQSVAGGRGKAAGELLGTIYGILESLMDYQIITNNALLEHIKSTVDELLPYQTGLRPNHNLGLKLVKPQDNKLLKSDDDTHGLNEALQRHELDEIGDPWETSASAIWGFAFGPTDSMPGMTLDYTLPTSNTASTCTPYNTWDGSNVGNIPDTFGFAPNIKTALQRCFADDLATTLALCENGPIDLDPSVASGVSRLLEEFAILCRDRARSEQVSAVDEKGFNRLGSDKGADRPYTKNTRAAPDDFELTPADQELPEENASDGHGNPSTHELLAQSVEQSRVILHRSTDYSWLLSQIETLGKSHDGLTTTRDLRRAMLNFIDRTANPLSGGRRILRVALPWEPLQFLKSQFPYATELPPLESVITISGSSITPYATTCGEYVRLIWPRYGQEALTIAQDRIDQLAALKSEHLSGDRVPLTTFQISGSGLRLIEIAEALIWLAVACRASGNSKSTLSIQSCKPRIETDQTLPLTFRIELETEDILNGGVSDCWQDMFRNPVVALGYPVPKRSHNELGLEVTTSMLRVLSRAARATVFGGVVVLKGWSTMAMVVAKIKESVMWHFVCNQTGDRIAYPQNQQTEPLSITEAFSPESRHFVGWTNSADIIIGTSDAHYNDIWWSHGLAIDPGVCLDPVLTVSGGKFVTAALRISAGTKDTPTFLKTDNYRDCIDKASRWNVIFSDTETRLHWLSDGASAILHFCKAYLSPGQTPRHGSHDILAQIRPFEAKEAYGPDWAFEVLVDPDLRRIPMHVSSVDHKDRSTHKDASEERSREETTTWGTFQSLAEKFFMYLEQAHDRASNIRLSKDIYIKMSFLRSEIVGFDFKSILQGDSCVEPKRFKLATPSQTWLDFSTQIDSINILGSNFGTLIRPSVPVTPFTLQRCAQLSEPPKGRDYLVAPLSVLRIIAERHRNHTQTSVQLTDTLYWHDVNGSFQGCTCKSQPLSRCRWLVGELHSKAADVVKEGIKREHPIFAEHGKAAIIFGHESNVLHKSPSSSASSAAQSDGSLAIAASSPSTRTSDSSGSRRSGSFTSARRKLRKFWLPQPSDDKRERS